MARLFAVITGGSGGIGLELARLAAADGYDLLLVARNDNLLTAVAGELATASMVETLPLDLGVAGAAKVVFDHLNGRSVDLLVNNAGFATYGSLATSDPDEISSEIGGKHCRSNRADAIIGPWDVEEQTWDYHQPGFNSGLFAGADVGGLLCNQGLRPFVIGRAG